MTTLHRLLYSSHCAISGTQAEVDAQVAEIVEAARVANQQCDLTGALMFSSGSFVQALEGPIAAVEATFERICSDMRHKDLRLIDLTVADSRSFAGWPLATIGASGKLISLCATLDPSDGSATDPANGAATIQLMRAMILTGSPGLATPTTVGRTAQA